MLASKFCAHCFLPLFERGFTETFMMTLVHGALYFTLIYSHRIREKSNEIYAHATDPQDVIRYSTFLAELFFRVRTQVTLTAGICTPYVCAIHDRRIIHCGHLVLCLLRLCSNWSQFHMINL